MTEHERRTIQHPADEREADTSTQSATGRTAGKSAPDGPGVERSRARDDDEIANRIPPRHETPRRYDERSGEDPVMPADDPSLGTKI
jgi:hypothetical protein